MPHRPYAKCIGTMTLLPLVAVQGSGQCHWHWRSSPEHGDQLKRLLFSSLFSWWARWDLNPQGLFSQRILSPPRIPIPPLARLESNGGTDRVRTGVRAFAELCLTTRPRRHSDCPTRVAHYPRWEYGISAKTSSVPGSQTCASNSRLKLCAILKYLAGV